MSLKQGGTVEEMKHGCCLILEKIKTTRNREDPSNQGGTIEKMRNECCLVLEKKKQQQVK
jgi:hypothetical protein